VDVPDALADFTRSYSAVSFQARPYIQDFPDPMIIRRQRFQLLLLPPSRTYRATAGFEARVQARPADGESRRTDSCHIAIRRCRLPPSPSAISGSAAPLEGLTAPDLACQQR
jgi:hypothetical protein